MITAILLAVLGLLLIVVLVQMMRTPAAGKQPAPAVPPAAAGSDLTSARPGDVISIHGAAEDYADLDFTVDRRSAYQTNGRRWIGLSGEFRGRRVYLEVHSGAEPEVMGLIDPRRLTLADIGVTEDRLADLDARQDPSQTVPFEGKPWRYESSRELGYFENEQGAGEGLYRWLFAEQNGRRLLCVEKWEGEPFDVRIAQRLNPQDIGVYRAA